ncbi:hypothetical protein BD769DRAFT_1711225 [Suillus cothurnatus]|nr:hypothetical protein BD769DRAFT_1711225 [Suillus cothurnatus]
MDFQPFPSPSLHQSSTIVQAVDPNEPPPKRKRGRLKGSGKTQSPDPAIISEKIKHPVGCPHKDGLPAGSVGAQKANQQPRLSVKLSADALQPLPGVPFPGAYYPQHPGILPPWQGFTPQVPQSIPPITNGNSAPNAQHPSIDPNLNRDEWAEHLCTKPNVLMQALLGAITAPNPIASGGPSVEEAFRSHLASLMPSQTQNKDAYSIPSLRLPESFTPSTNSYIGIRYLSFLPAFIVQRAGAFSKTEVASEAAHVSCIASTTPEGRKFASTDASVMQGLPVRLREKFPAWLLQDDADLGPGANIWNWHAVGVSKTLWNMVKACLKVGIPKDNILNIINAVQNPPADEKRDQDQELDVDNSGVGADIFHREIDNNNQDAIGEFRKADSSAPKPGPSTQIHPTMPQPSSSTLGSAMPDHPTSSVSTSMQPQPQPQAQAQAHKNLLSDSQAHMYHMPIPGTHITHLHWFLGHIHQMSKVDLNECMVMVRPAVKLRS